MILFLLLFIASLSAIPPELTNLPYGIYPDNPQYNTVRLNYNKLFSVFPQAIFVPTDPSEVAYVLQSIKKYKLPFSIRSGGHCFEPGSLSSAYIIDLKKFNAIIPDIANEEVYIGAGCLLKDVIQELGTINYAIPTGTCPTVGVTGLTLGGGIGLLGRAYGLTCDSVKNITFMKADGSVITVSKNHHSDLFWALLGGGNGSYGIVLGFTFKMYYIPKATYYELIWEWDTKKIIPIMETWQEWVKTLPDSISTVIGIRHPNTICSQPENTPPLVIRVFGLKVGAEPFFEWKGAFAKLNPQMVNITETSYIDTVNLWSNEPDLPFNKAKSRILMQPISTKVMEEVVQFFEKIEDLNFLVYFNFEAFGGKIPDNKTSFFPRNAFGWWFQAYYWKREEQTEPILALSRKFYNKIPSEVSKYSYTNATDYDLGKYYLTAYYGSNAKRLIDIKRKYDPANLFRWRQSIPLIRTVPGSLICP